MTNKGFIERAGKHHCIMLTDSNCKTKEILKRFVSENPDYSEKAKAEVLEKFDLYADDMRKTVDQCTIEKTENTYIVTIQKKNRPKVVCNYPIESGKLFFIEEV